MAPPREISLARVHNMESVELKTIRRFAMRSKWWMMAYMNGLSEEQRSYAEKQYKSHRRETRHIFVVVCVVQGLSLEFPNTVIFEALWQV